jgi:hypothetical protein
MHTGGGSAQQSNIGFQVFSTTACPGNVCSRVGALVLRSTCFPAGGEVCKRLSPWRAQYALSDPLQAVALVTAAFVQHVYIHWGLTQSIIFDSK